MNRGGLRLVWMTFTQLMLFAAEAPSAWAVEPIDAGLVQLPASPMVAADRFERFRCVECHAIGAARDRVGPNLGRIDLRSSFLDGAAGMWNHIPGMSHRMLRHHVTWPQVRGDDLLNLIAYFTTYQYYLTHVGRPGSPERGRVLFQDKGCDKCHAISANVKSKAPNLERYGKGGSVLVLAQAMWNHGPKMQEMLEQNYLQRPHFREREMADVLAYIATLGSEDGRRTPYLQPGDPARGVGAFRDHGCAQCHAMGGEPATVPTPAGEEPAPNFGARAPQRLRDYTDIAALMWNHGVTMWSRMQRQGITIRPLRNSELADIVAFLYFANFIDEPGDPVIGRDLFINKGCATCHEAAVHPIGLKVSPELSLERLRTTARGSVWDTVAAMWRSGPAMLDQMRQRGVLWPKIGGGQMRHLIAFIRQARSDTGAAGLPGRPIPNGSQPQSQKLGRTNPAAAASPASAEPEEP